MGKRQRAGHLIAGLGDGNVHNGNINGKVKSDVDELFLRRSSAHMRGSRNQQTFSLEEVYPSGDGIHSVHKPSMMQSSWQYYAMALIAMMGLLLALFLHLVTDSAPNSDENKRGRRSWQKHKKKKTDEWSDDCATDSYTGDNEAIAGAATFDYFPKEPEYPKNRKKDQQGQPNRNFYFSAEHPNLSTYRSPSNSFYVHQESPPPFGTPIRGINLATDMSPSFSQKSKAKRLSPVSSFASMVDADHQSDSSMNLPLPRGVTRGSQHSSSQMKFSPPLYDTETPKAGLRRKVIDLEGKNTPIAPSLDISLEAASQDIYIPFLPNLAGSEKPNWTYSEPPQSISVEELHSAMESGNIRHDPSFSASIHQAVESSSSFVHTTQDSVHSFALSPLRRVVHPVEEGEESSDDNDPRKNIIHKRKNLTQSTDTTKSLLSTIRFDELHLEEVIGGGGFGQVWRATWRSTPVAVKVLTGSAQRVNVSKAILEEFAAEINMLKGMRHPNICLYMGACLDPPNRAIVTELAANGSLWDALRLPLHAPFVVADGFTRDAWHLKLYPENSIPAFPPKGTWPWALVKRVASGAARGMTYLHSGLPPVLHRDLKSANLLLDESYTAKVCDFGLSRLKAQERSMTGNCGTVQWMAPEILASQPYAEPADVFSFGIILWELLTAECPFEGMSAIQCALAVLNRDQRPQIPGWCPPALSLLISSCVKRNPSQRPTFAQVCLALEAMPS
ncbi:protein kinase [Fragilaria crotonensis]|nr:protein kinase [Fragilaria crotonensis]